MSQDYDAIFIGTGAEDVLPTHLAGA